MIRLLEAREEQRELLWNIHQKYLYEMTRYYDNEMDEKGNYHYGYFDAYFLEPERRALLIYDGDALAGFALVNPHSYIGGKPDCVMAEFTIFPMFRRRKIGAQAAERIFEAFPGSWELKFNEKNAGAKAFWTKVTEKYGPEKHRYSDTETVLCFSVRGN